MPSLRQCSPLVIVLHKLQLHQLSPISPSSKMKIISKAPGLLKKAAATFKSKTCALRARLLILASLRRRLAMVGAISHRIHALMAEREKAGLGPGCDKALVLRKAAAAVGGEKPAHGEMLADLSRQLALFDQGQGDVDHHGYHDWTHSLFKDDDNSNCYTGEDNGDDRDDVLLDALGDNDEPSVIDIIRSSREVEGMEFNIYDEIDQAADMFIARFRKRMNRSF